MKTYSRLTLAFLLLILAVPRANAAEEWRFDKAGKRLVFHGDAISCKKNGQITLQEATGTKTIVNINELDEKCRRKARLKFGLAVIDMSGYWRSDSNSFYEILERDNEIFINLVDSHHIKSLQAKFIRRENRKVFRAKNYTIVFKKYPGKKLDVNQVKVELSPKDGDLEFSYNKSWAVNAQGNLVPWKGKLKWTRISREALPAKKLPSVQYNLKGG